MLEIPEAYVISEQLRKEIVGAKVVSVTANTSPHKLTWYYENPDSYESRLVGHVVTDVKPLNGQVQIELENMRIALSDGVNIRVFSSGDKLPTKHQLLITFDHGKTVIFSVQMYGGIMAFESGENQNPYYLVAMQKPSPLTEAFDLNYFKSMVNHESRNPTLKAFLATEQRFPGIGNGVLQDILFNAGMHPKRKLNNLSEQDIENLYLSIKNTLDEMVERGGRDTEKDIYGESGRYLTKLSKNTHNQPCHRCGEPIRKESYMGGSIYYCVNCQKL
ncbi:MAG: endonuclease VIII [Clostridiales bacterium]|nr:endonuclease VIII [Clostridiales bacterium]